VITLYLKRALGGNGFAILPSSSSSFSSSSSKPAERTRTRRIALEPQETPAPTLHAPRSTLHVFILFLWLACPALLCGQQQNLPHIGYVYPAGGRQGTAFQVTLGGQYVYTVTSAFISGPGVKVSIIDHTRPITPQQLNALREKLKELQDRKAAAGPAPATKAGNAKKSAPAVTRSTTNAVMTNVVFTAADQKLLVETRQKVMAAQRKPPNPAIAETVTLRISLDASAEPGERELRLTTPLGLSNPLIFCIGQLPEFRKNEPPPPAQPPPNNNNNTTPGPTAPTDTTVTLPAVLNGQIMPGGVDRYHFPAHKGQRLVVAVNARSLIPYLADAVPGWFQATVALYDTKGKELAYDDHYRFHPDPVISCVIPNDGQYTVEVRDSIYRGREDFVYRISIGELPFITSIFPLGGPARAKTRVELKGWNLLETSLTQDDTDVAAGVYPITVRNGDKFSNGMPFMVDTLPECIEAEPNNTPANAQTVTLPIIINGRINEPGDRDVFRFEGHFGEAIVAEVYARRLDSPLDSVLKLTDASGKQLAFNDDFEDKGSGLDTHHADSYLTATLPADGNYFLEIADVQRQGGPEYGYRLRLSTPQPDFALRIVPSSISARAGMNAPVTVYALRKDGFTNAITLALSDAPAGLTLSGNRVPEAQDQVRLTLKVPAAIADSDPISLSLEGRATINGRQVVHRALPADDMMQAFAYRHLVPAQELKLDVIGAGRGIAPNAGRVIGATPVRIIAGQTNRVLITTPTAAFVDRWDFELSDPPAGLSLQKVSAVAQGAEIVLNTDATKLKPGLKGNLIINLYPGKAVQPAAQPAAKKQAAVRRVAGTLPAIPYEVVAP
jgi:hypothetical protein